MNAGQDVPIYLEIGQKRIFAGSVDWPGWCRSGRDEATALAALLAYGPRFARVLVPTTLEFTAPTSTAAFRVVDRLQGNATTDFGAPDVALDSDSNPLNEADLKRFGLLLQACWGALDTAIAAAAGVELRKGPRGGGRELEAISRHVLGAEQGYLSRLAWKAPKSSDENLNEEMRVVRQAIMDALAAAVRGEIPERGPRGGVIWPARYFIRRVAWHVLDHAWEIEDRAQ
ncbi:MAG TPA: hypothetical protein VF434_05205 [Promineifilum sp.]